MANKIYPGYSNSSATLHDDGDETSLGGPDTKQSQIHSNVIPGEIPDSNNSLHEPKTRGGGREYLHVVRPGELVAAGALPGVEVVHADQTSDGLASASTDGRLLPAAGSAVRSRPRTDYKRKGNMPDGPTPRANAVKYTSEVIGADNSPQENGFCAIILTALSYILVIMFFPFSLCATIKVVQEYERAVIFRLGRLLPGGAKGPGIFFVMPCIEEYSKVDLRTVSFDVPPQEVLTRDSVTVSVDAVVYYRISSPTVSVANVENAANSTQLLAQTTLRNVLGTQNLSEILSNREHISEQMQNVLDDATDKWGIKVERVEIKDVRLPTQLQRAMAAEAEAARDARAKVIAAEGEQKASFALKEAADIIGGSPAALQLRYLQTLNSISAEKNSTIIFPVPIDFITGVIKN